MSIEWPELNSLVWLRLPCCGAEHPTRVEDLTDDNRLIVAWPMAPHVEPVPLERASRGFFVGWVLEGRGAMEVSVDLAENTLGEKATWTVKAIGDPVETQRRNFVRFPIYTEVKLFMMEGTPPVVAPTLDVSEGGIRCTITRWAIDPGSRLFDIEVELDKKTYVVKARVAWWGNLDAKQKRVIGIEFMNVEPAVSDSIRRFIFAAQIEERRRQLL